MCNPPPAEHCCNTAHSIQTLTHSAAMAPAAVLLVVLQTCQPEHYQAGTKTPTFACSCTSSRGVTATITACAMQYSKPCSMQCMATTMKNKRVEMLQAQITGDVVLSDVSHSDLCHFDQHRATAATASAHRTITSDAFQHTDRPSQGWVTHMKQLLTTGAALKTRGQERSKALQVSTNTLAVNTHAPPSCIAEGQSHLVPYQDCPDVQGIQRAKSKLPTQGFFTTCMQIFSCRTDKAAEGYSLFAKMISCAKGAGRQAPSYQHMRVACHMVATSPSLTVLSTLPEDESGMMSSQQAKSRGANISACP